MSYRLLLVDDDKVFRGEFKEAMQEYDVVEANDGAEAIAILRKPNDIDLAILDVRLPGQSGTDVLKEVRKIVPDLAIIILTGYSSKSVAIEALKSHADDYLEKPIDPEHTKEVIEKVLEAHRVVKSPSAGGISGKIERVKELARRNWRKIIYLNDVAEMVCLSPKYLSRVFKNSTGMGFNRYRLKIKIEKTQEYLKSSEYNINEIANIMGYENTESLIRIFKKMTGLTPTEYRRKARSDKKNHSKTKHSKR